MPLAMPGDISGVICGMNSLARRKSNWKSLVAIRPLGGRPRVEPSINSGASFFTWVRATILRNLSPSGATPTPLRASKVSRARTASSFGTGLTILIE